MKVYLDEHCTLVIMPETHEEKFALSYWSQQEPLLEKLLVIDVDPEQQLVVYNKEDGKRK